MKPERKKPSPCQLYDSQEEISSAIEVVEQRVLLELDRRIESRWKLVVAGLLQDMEEGAIVQVDNQHFFMVEEKMYKVDNVGIKTEISKNEFIEIWHK